MNAYCFALPATIVNYYIYIYFKESLAYMKLRVIVGMLDRKKKHFKFYEAQVLLFRKEYGTMC